MKTCVSDTVSCLCYALNMANDTYAFVPRFNFDVMTPFNEDNYESLKMSLQISYNMLAELCIETGAKLTADTIERVLPGYLLTFTANVSMYGPPIGDIPIGIYRVSQEFKDKYLDLLAEPIAELKAFCADDDDGLWEKPTPNQTIRKFCFQNRMGHSREFVNLLWEAKNGKKWEDSFPDDATQRYLLRWMDTPLKRTTNVYRKPIKSQMEFVKLMHGVMVKKDPTRYGSLPIEHLIWRAVEPAESLEDSAKILSSTSSD